MSQLPIQLLSDQAAFDDLDLEMLAGVSGDFSESLTVKGIPVSLSGHDPHGSGNFSTSLHIPSGVDEIGYTFSGMGNEFIYPEVPQVIATMRFYTGSNFFYGYSTYNVSLTGFYVAFTDIISETGHYLDLVVNRDPE